MHAILGAGGAVGNELARILAGRNIPVRLVSRQPKPLAGAETVSADLAERADVVGAVAGAEVVYLLAGFKYDLRVWRRIWPLAMENTIEACKQAGARLVFLDNVYMYGRVAGPMTEETPCRPCSAKGELRARIAARLMDEVMAGGLTALIARSADFYGPSTPNGVPNILVFDALAKGSTPSWLVNDTVAHSFTFTPDVALGLAMLASRATAWNQVWHLPTSSPPLSGREFVAMAAAEFGAPAKLRVLGKPMLRIAGWFNSDVRESMEMLYQAESPYIFDSSKFARAFGFAGTPYADGIRMVASSYKQAN